MAAEPADDVGGDAPCWAHLFADATVHDDAVHDDAHAGAAVAAASGIVVDLGATDTRGRDGVVWSLPHGGDLDANLVRLGGGGGMAT